MRPLCKVWLFPGKYGKSYKGATSGRRYDITVCHANKLQLRREANSSIRRPPASPSKLRNSIASPRSCRSSSARARSITKRLFHKSFGVKTPPRDLPHDYQLCTSPRTSQKVLGPGKQSRHGWWKTNNRANIIVRERRSNSRLCSPAGEYHRSQ